MALKSEEWQTLAEIRQIASSMAQLIQSTHSIPTPPTIINFDIPALQLSHPSNILAPISDLQISEDLRQSLLDCFHRRINELQEQYLQSYRRACRDSMQGSILKPNTTAIKDVFEALYNRNCIPMLETNVSAVVAQVRSRQQSLSSNVSDVKRSFNSDFVPMLEKYFNLNGYPSVAHRSLLAKKSMMTPRQIEVWFQNHRNRAKKESRSVPRLESDFPLHCALNMLKQIPSTPPNRIPTPPPENSIDITKQAKFPISRFSSSSAISSPTILEDSYKSRPPHAYPASKHSSYPDAFPSNDGVFKFPPPTWTRKPATTPIVSTAVDMDEFAQFFHLKLNFSENSRRRGTSPQIAESPPYQPWFSATTIFTTSAPHPALLRTAHGTLSNVSAPVALFAPSIPSFGLNSLFASATSISSHSETSARKKRPLPRRTRPQSRTSSFGSRTSSFSSDISSGRRTSSSSSDFSSPELSTPLLLPHLDLPSTHGDVQQFDLFDFSHIHPDTNYSFADFLPSQDFNLLNTYSESNKFANVSCFDNTFPDFGHNLGDILS